MKKYFKETEEEILSLEELLQMQVVNEHYWQERSIYYLCNSFENLNRGADHLKVKAAVQIGSYPDQWALLPFMKEYAMLLGKVCKEFVNYLLQLYYHTNIFTWRKNEMKRVFQYLCICVFAALLCAGCNGKNDKADTKQSEAPAESTEGSLEIPSEASQYFAYEIDQEKKYATITSYLDEEEEIIVVPDHFEYEGEDYPVTTIAEEAFYYNTVLKRIILPETVTAIGKEAFCKCEALEEIEIPGTVVTLGTGLFYDCTALKKVTFGEGIVSLPDEIFTNCFALKELNLPSTLVSIGNEVFWSCTDLQTLDLPANVVAIGSRTFYSSGIKNLTLRSASINITEDIFEGADELETISVPESLVAAVESAVIDTESVKVEALKE